MKCDKTCMRLYAVTDRSWVGKQSLYEQVESALKGGVTCVQLREKHLNEEAFLEEAIPIRDLCRRYRVPFLIDDNVEIALRCQADGVHVGQKDMAVLEVRKRVGDGMIIGASAHNVEEAIKAQQDGADYLGVGAVFATSTKSDAKPLSWSMLSRICQSVSIPVVAIGGIGKENLLSLSGSGVDGVAVVSAIFSAEDIETACKELRSLSERMVNG